jgi:hypothetical protein
MTPMGADKSEKIIRMAGLAFELVLATERAGGVSNAQLKSPNWIAGPSILGLSHACFGGK